MHDAGLAVGSFVHGLWLLSSNWAPWREFFEDNRFVALAPGWPDDPATVAEARDHPEAFAKKMVQQVTDHYLEAIAQLDRSPAVIGHSLRESGERGTRGVLDVGAVPVRLGERSQRGRGATPVEEFHVPAAGVARFQAAFANFNPFGGDKQVDSKNPTRGPLLIIGGEKDHTGPPVVINASYEIQAM